MRSLILKEARELALPFLIALVLSCVFLLVTANFEDVLLRPNTDTDSIVLWWGCLCGALIGYRQFAGELRRGTARFLLHRGTGRQGAFLAKVAVGSLASLCLAELPPAIYSLGYAFATAYGPIVQPARVATLLLCGSFALPAYAAGVFAVAIGGARGRRLLFAFAATYGAIVTALWGATELAGAGWRWSGPLVSVALVTAALLALAWPLLRREIDPEFALPTRSSVAMALASLALAVAPTAFALKVLQSFTTHLGGPWSLLAQDRATGEFFTVTEDADRNWRRVDGKPIAAGVESLHGTELWEHRDQLSVFLPFAREADFRPPSLTPPQILETLHEQLGALTVGYYGALWSWIVLFPSDGVSEDEPRSEFVLDANRSFLRCFRFPTRSESGDSRFAAGTAWSAKEYEVVLPGGGRSWILGDDERSARLFDPADGSLWRFVRSDGELRVVPAEWPGGDRLQRVEDLYAARYAVLGQYARGDKLFVCERGRYVWLDDGFVDYDLRGGTAAEPGQDVARASIPKLESEANVSELILAAEVPSRTVTRVEQVEMDPLAPSWILRDAHTEEILFSWCVEPPASHSPWSWLATEGLWLLRPPAAVAWNFLQPAQSGGGYRRPFLQAFFAGGSNGLMLFAGGRRAGLAAACAGLGLALAVWVLRRRKSPFVARCAWAAMVALFGVPVFILFRFCESRSERVVLERRSARLPFPVAEPLIQST